MSKKEKNTPEHVAVIMDGNGRWAKQRGLKHLEGHRRGADAVERIVEASKELGIKYLTLYAFSTENWRRSPEEVNGLMNLLKEFLDEKLDTINEKGVRLRAIGRLDKLPSATRKKLEHSIEVTRDNTEGNLILALNYGGRTEIVDAARKIAEDAISGKIKPAKLDEKLFADYLYAPDVPDPELMIRTSGEFRLSNFLLWQLSYSEIYITDVLWPDFDKEEFAKAIQQFKSRDRRFGGR
jgi:undecaprenyl diphosphate synthase